MAWVAVAVGGALGSLARYAVNLLTRTQQFPVATLFVNLTGCLVTGFLAGMIASHRIGLPAPWREFVFVGLLGGFTTFSAFGLDTFLLARAHSSGFAAVNISLQVVGGLLAVWLGFRFGSGS